MNQSMNKSINESINESMNMITIPGGCGCCLCGVKTCLRCEINFS